MAPELVPASATVVSTGKGLRYIGEHAFAYSGQIAYSQVETLALEFTSGAGYIVANFGFSFAVDSSDDAYVRIYLNNLEIIQSFVNNITDSWPENPIPIIIPPFTEVKTSVQSLPTASKDGFFSYLTGRVYGV